MPDPALWIGHRAGGDGVRAVYLGRTDGNTAGALLMYVAAGPAGQLPAPTLPVMLNVEHMIAETACRAYAEGFRRGTGESIEIRGALP